MIAPVETLPDLSILRGARNVAALAVLEEAGAKKSGAGGIKGLMMGRADVFFLSPYDVHVEEGWNGRDFTDPANVKHVRELTESIKAQGVKESLTVYRGEDGRFFLSNGECRLRGVFGAISDGAPVFSIPVRVEPRESTDEERIAGQIVRNTGKPFSPMELARICKRLVDKGWNREKIASHVGSLTKERIGQLLALLEMPEQVQQQVTEGVISATEAARVVREHGDEAPEIIERAASLSAEGNGKLAGKATRSAIQEATAEIVSGATREPESAPTPPLTLRRVLSILSGAVAVQDGDKVEISLSAEDWAAISAGF